MVQFDRRIDVAVGGTAARVGFETDPVTQVFLSKAGVNERQVVSVRLIHGKEAVCPSKDVFSSCKAFLGEEGRKHRAVGRLTGLETLGQRAVDDALPVSGRLTVGDAEGVDHLRL